MAITLQLARLSDEYVARCASDSSLFDAWVSGDTSGIYRPTLAAEMNDRNQLEALHELIRLKNEALRYNRIVQLETKLPANKSLDVGTGRWGNPQQQLADAQRRIADLERLLASGGWLINAATVDLPPQVPHN